MSHLIWVPKKIIEPKDPMILTSGVKGFIRMEVIKPGIGTRVDTGWFPNMILDSGLDNFGTQTLTGSVTQVGVGAGVSSPSPEQSSLESPIAWTTTTGPGGGSGSGGSWDEGNYYRYFRVGRQFQEGAAAGILGEIGFCRGGTSERNNLTVRARITDGSGNPTTITVLEDEILQVVYEIRHYFNPTFLQGSMELSGIPYSYTLGAREQGSGDRGIYTYGDNYRLIALNNVSNFGSVGENLTGGSSVGVATSSPTLSPYSEGSHYRDSSTNFSLTQGNAVGGIEYMRADPSTSSTPFLLKMRINPPIPKDNTKLMTLNMRYSWGRYDP